MSIPFIKLHYIIKTAIFNMYLCVTDVLALAAAIGELGTHTRRARTAQWCALQVSTNDMPEECKRSISAHQSPSKPSYLALLAKQESPYTDDPNNNVK
jgi:hypothetical protein